MHEASRKSIAAIGIALALGLGSTATSRADTSTGPHGGTLQVTKHHQFETVINGTGVKVYPYAMDGKPLDTTKLSGTATFYHPSTPKPWFDRSLNPTPASPGQVPISLDRTIDLSKVPVQGVKVTVEITGLTVPPEPSASFTVPLSLTQAPVAAARPVPVPILVAKATQADQAVINAQRVCKVSGESLGSMGTPIKVTRGNSYTFLCCQGCLKTVQANPDRYLGASR